MNGPVDFVSRMRHAADVLETAGMGAVTAADLRAGADAFAELIEADRELDLAYAEFPRVGAEKSAIDRAAQRVGFAITRRQAALADMGGAA